jgi:hypothetical protein
LVDGGAVAGEAFEDLVGGLVPDKGGWGLRSGALRISAGCDGGE